ncbi:MAG: DUF6691 family protein [Polyangiales bacterium]
MSTSVVETASPSTRTRPLFYVASFAAGAAFAIGLVLSGMTRPIKIVRFFDFAGAWDPSLAFVMGAALMVYVPGYRWLSGSWNRPWLAPRFLLPQREEIDARLLGGAAVFGIGWGIAGYCPGPAISAVGAMVPSALIFTGAMVVPILVRGFLGRGANDGCGSIDLE